MAVKKRREVKKRISGGSVFEQEIGYSRAIVDGNYVFVSGTTGYDYSTMTISDDPAVQAEQCFVNIEKALSQAGASLLDIVRIRYIVPNRDDFERCWPVFEKNLGAVKPAATMFVAGLFDDKMKIEIEVTARLSS